MRIIQVYVSSIVGTKQYICSIRYFKKKYYFSAKKYVHINYFKAF